MARKHILVEDPLYSHELVKPGRVGSDVILIYLHAGVPVSLATDDEGVIRSDLTQSFVRAVQGYGIGYATLKTLVRDSLEHAFVPGTELWAAPEAFSTMAPACAGQPLVVVPPSPRCRALLATSEKARLEWREEVVFAQFERRY
jgi:adenosine deaminase